MPVAAALAHDPAATPVAVVLGGPSAEHDVSIVSGSAIADALRGVGLPGRDLADRPRRGLVAPAGRVPPRRPAAGRLRRPRAPWARPARSTPAWPLERARRARRPPVVFLALHGPFGEDGTAQALCEAAGLAYTGSGVTASAVGMDKAIFKRLVRGLGPARDGLGGGPRRRAGPRDPEAVLAELEAFAAGGGDPRLMVKPARLGSSVGMTLAHAAGERAAALDEAFRYDDLALVERYLAGARDLEVVRDGQRARRAGAVRPGRDHVRPRVLRLPAKYTPGLSRDDADRRGHAGPAGARSSSSPATPTAPSAPRASRASTSCSRATRSSCPRSTRSRGSRRSACSRRCAPRAATTSPPSAGASWTSPSRASVAASATGSTGADLPR